MPDAWILAPLLLIAVLGVSGATKLGRTDQTMSAMTSLRVPLVLRRRSLAAALPWAELALAAGLLVLPARWALLAAVPVTVLMLVYLVLVVAALRREEEADCGCFGDLVDSRVTMHTAIRNSILVVLAVVAMTGAWSHWVIGSLAGLGGGWWWLLGALVTAVLVYSIVAPQEAGDAPEAMPGPEPAEGEDVDYVRAPIPYSLLVAPDGSMHTLPQLARNKARLLIFTNPHCFACTQVNQQLPEWVETMPEIGIHPVYFSDDALAASTLSGEVKKHAFVDPHSVTMAALETGGTPSAVLLGADGLMAGGPVRGTQDVIDFAAQIREQLASAQAAETP